jgi:uncharacterized protein with PhoU and TrkA domain
LLAFQGKGPIPEPYKQSVVHIIALAAWTKHNLANSIKKLANNVNELKQILLEDIKAQEKVVQTLTELREFIVQITADDDSE